MSGWLVDKSVSARSSNPRILDQLREMAGTLYLCPIGRLEQLYSTRSAEEYDALVSALDEAFEFLAPPARVFDEALAIQRDLAHRHGLWHRVPIPDLLIAVTALTHQVGVLHVDADFERIAAVRPLMIRRLET